MSLIRLFLLTLLFFIACTTFTAANAATKGCTVEQAMAADAAYPAKSWHSLREQFDLYSNCDDGGIAEGYDDDVISLLVEHWSEVSDLEKEFEADGRFRQFVLRHINELASVEQLNAIGHNAKEHCPNLETLCHDLAEAATLTTPLYVPEDLFAKALHTVDRRLAQKFTMGNFVGSFEKTRLILMEKMAKAGSIQHMGDAGESTSWLCYTLTNKKPPERIWLTSGELHGGSEISGLDIASMDADTKPTKLCPKLPSNLQPIKIENGITLGITRDQLIKRLGKPSKEQGDWMLYSHAGKLKGDYDEIGWLLAYIQDERVVRLQTGKTTTN